MIARIKHGRARLLVSAHSTALVISTPRATLRRALSYVGGATGLWSLFWRSLRAAWWCARASGGAL